MKAKVRMRYQALDEFNKLKKIVSQEEKEGIKSSENITLLN